MYAFPYVFNVVAFILSENGFRNSESDGSTGLVRKCLLLSVERAMIEFGVWA